MSEAAATSPGPQLAPSIPEGLPSSAETIYRILAVEGPLTHKELVEISEMPPRTVRYAVSRLKDEGCIGERCNLMDCRQRFFFIDASYPAGEDEPDNGHISKL